jgi:hypothetical protein
VFGFSPFYGINWFSENWDSNSSITDLQKRPRLLDPDPQHSIEKYLSILNPKVVTKLSEIWSRTSGKKSTGSCIPDPDPHRCLYTYYILLIVNLNTYLFQAKGSLVSPLCHRNRAIPYILRDAVLLQEVACAQLSARQTLELWRQRLS